MGQTGLIFCPVLMSAVRLRWLLAHRLSPVGLYPMFPDSFSAAFSTFTLIALAEMGDKSQLVCMTLAARHRHWPVLLGAVVAFSVLNVLAVLFGAAVATWVPEAVMAGIVAVLFAVFGIQSLRSEAGDESEEVEEKPGHGIFVTTLLLLLVAHAVEGMKRWEV